MKCHLMQKRKRKTSKKTESLVTHSIQEFMTDSMINGIEVALQNLRRKTERLKQENEDSAS